MNGAATRHGRAAARRRARVRARRLTEVESRVEGIEYLLADLRATAGAAAVTAPEAARLVEEERHRASLQSNNERNHHA